jgi:hypothetical protein
MVTIPQSNNLPIKYLAAIFDNVTNSYKFYWFLAILEQIRENQSRTIPINNLLARMISSVWYPTNYFRLSFGKQDRLGQIAVQVGEYSGLSIDSNRQEVIRAVQGYLASDSSLARDIKSLGQYVPFRFLRPFFAQQLRGLEDWKVNESVEGLATQAFADTQFPCIYRFVYQPAYAIEIQADWFEYLTRHLTILIDFCLWNLVRYVQKNNPNAPNISNKLFEPEHRNLNQARAFWRLVFDKVGELTCIYSGQVMQIGGFSLDHFLPWRFVAHDLLWNMIPTLRNVNSAKSDNLPDLNRYFDPFAQLQYNAVQMVAISVKAHLLEDHILLLGVSSIAEIQGLSFQSFRERLHDTIAPQFQIATNMGFPGQWSYP